REMGLQRRQATRLDDVFLHVRIVEIGNLPLTGTRSRLRLGSILNYSCGTFVRDVAKAAEDANASPVRRDYRAFEPAAVGIKIKVMGWNKGTIHVLYRDTVGGRRSRFVLCRYRYQSYSK